jgi:hypothetical protein
MADMYFADGEFLWGHPVWSRILPGWSRCASADSFVASRDTSAPRGEEQGEQKRAKLSYGVGRLLAPVGVF